MERYIKLFKDINLNKKIFINYSYFFLPKMQKKKKRVICYKFFIITDQIQNRVLLKRLLNVKVWSKMPKKKHFNNICLLRAGKIGNL